MNKNATTQLNPYVGPRSFTVNQAQRFKGRDREANELLSLLLARRLTLFYSQSGAGKTSLLNARLIPMLQEEQVGFEVLPVGRVGDSIDPPESVNGSFNIFIFNLAVSLGVTHQPEQLAGLRLSDFLLDIVHDGQQFSYVGGGDETKTAIATDESEEEHHLPLRPRALIIDQFEEIFTVHPERERERVQFFNQITEAMEQDPYLYVLFSMRGDYIDRLSPYVKLLPDSLRTRYYMERMREDAALQAVRLPAQEAGRPFADDVSEKLVRYLRRLRTATGSATEGDELDPYVETVQLQVVCLQLWQSLASIPGDIITMDDVIQICARFATQEVVQSNSQEATDPLAVFIDNALASYYQQAIKTVLNHPDVSLAEYELRHWFSTELITAAGTRNLLARGETATEGVPEVVVALLDKEHYLVRNDMRGGRPFIELVHDSFIEPIRRANRQWETDRTKQIPWLAAALRYHETQNPALLLTGEALEAAQSQAETIQGLPAEAEAYLKASEVSWQQEEARRREALGQQELAHERSLREQANKAAVRQGKLTRIAFIVGGIAVIMAILAFFASSQASKNEERAESANAMAVVDRATAQAAEATAVSDRATAQAAEATAVVDRELAENAEAAAEAAQKIADSLRLANLARDYLKNGQTTSALLLSVEANKVLSAAADHEAFILTQDIINGLLLEALFKFSNETGSQSPTEIYFSRRLPSPHDMLTTIFPGPQPGTLATVQDGAIVYWSFDSTITETLELPDITKPISQATINQNGTKLALLQEQTIKVYSLVDGVANERFDIRIGEGNLASMVFNADGTHLAVAACLEDGLPNGSSEPIPTTTRGTSEATLTTTTTPTATTTPTITTTPSKTNCQIKIYELSENLKPIQCDLQLSTVTAVAFIDNQDQMIQMILSGTQGENFSQRLYLLQIGESCRQQAIPLPANHIIQAITVLPETENQSNLLITAGSNSMQWWQIDKNQAQIHPLGSPLTLPSSVSNIFSTAQQAFITLNEQNRLIAYNTDLSQWPEIGCGLANRNLTYVEWKNANPLYELDVYELDELRELEAYSCDEYGYEAYGLHISFAQHQLRQAQNDLQQCNLSEAESKYESAQTLVQQSNYETPIAENFALWAVDGLLNQYIMNLNSCSDPTGFDKILLSALGNDESLDESLIENFAQNLKSIANLIRVGNELSTGTPEQALANYEEALNQIVDLPENYHAFYGRYFATGYRDICTNHYVEEACSQLAKFATPLQLNTGNLANTGDTQVWAFEADGVDFVTINLQAPGSATYPSLTLYDPNGVQVVFSEGYETATLSSPLPKDGAYILLVGWQGEPGGYTMSVETTSPTVLTAETTNVSAEADQRLWSFNASQADLVTINLEAMGSENYSFLTLYNPNGEQIGYGEGYDIATISTLLSEDGPYTLAVHWANEPDRYMLSVETVSPTMITAGTTNVDAEAEQSLWQFNANQGDLVTINLEALGSENYSFLTLYNPNGGQIGYGEGHETVTLSTLLPENGNFTIEVRWANEPSSYMLSVETVSPTMIAAGITNVAAEAEQSLWQFNANQGDLVTINLVAAEIDSTPYVYLYDLNGRDIGRYSDFPGTSTAKSLLPEDGPYTIEVRWGSESSSYTLSVETVTPLLISGNSFSQDTGPEQRWWEFKGEQGTQVIITMEALEPEGDPYLRLYDAAGLEIWSNDNSDGTLNSRIEFVLPANGLYQIEADWFANPGRYRLTFTR